MKERILLFDIESAPNLSYCWGKWQQNILSFERERFLISFAYKWLGDGGIKVKSLRTCKGKTPYDDYFLVRELWGLMNQAEVVVAHNGRDFDCKLAQAFFVKHQMKPCRPYKIVDTKLVAKRHFFFNSNSLNDLCKYLGLGRKVKHSGFNMWLECMQGDEDALKRMELYNKHDIELLEALYLRMRPFMDNHPNLNVMRDRSVICPCCGGKVMQKRGWHITRVSRAQRYQCRTCGSWSFGKLQRLEVELR